MNEQLKELLHVDAQEFGDVLNCDLAVVDIGGELVGEELDNVFIGFLDREGVVFKRQSHCLPAPDDFEAELFEPGPDEVVGNGEGL